MLACDTLSSSLSSFFFLRAHGFFEFRVGRMVFGVVLLSRPSCHVCMCRVRVLFFSFLSFSFLSFFWFVGGGYYWSVVNGGLFECSCLFLLRFLR